MLRCQSRLMERMPKKGIRLPCIVCHSFRGLCSVFADHLVKTSSTTAPATTPRLSPSTVGKSQRSRQMTAMRSAGEVPLSAQRQTAVPCSRTNGLTPSLLSTRRIPTTIRLWARGMVLRGRCRRPMVELRGQSPILTCPSLRLAHN